MATSSDDESDEGSDRGKTDEGSDWDDTDEDCKRLRLPFFRCSMYLLGASNFIFAPFVYHLTRPSGPMAYTPFIAVAAQTLFNGALQNQLLNSLEQLVHEHNDLVSDQAIANLRALRSPYTVFDRNVILNKWMITFMFGLPKYLDPSLDAATSANAKLRNQSLLNQSLSEDAVARFIWNSTPLLPRELSAFHWMPHADFASFVTIGAGLGHCSDLTHSNCMPDCGNESSVFSVYSVYLSFLSSYRYLLPPLWLLGHVVLFWLFCLPNPGIWDWVVKNPCGTLGTAAVELGLAETLYSCFYCALWCQLVVFLVCVVFSELMAFCTFDDLSHTGMVCAMELASIELASICFPSCICVGNQRTHSLRVSLQAFLKIWFHALLEALPAGLFTLMFVKMSWHSRESEGTSEISFASNLVSCVFSMIGILQGSLAGILFIKNNLCDLLRCSWAKYPLHFECSRRSGCAWFQNMANANLAIFCLCVVPCTGVALAWGTELSAYLLRMIWCQGGIPSITPKLCLADLA